PSRGEGFGIVYLEAMAYAKPVVAADAGGAPFVVRPGVSGALVPYAAPEHIASCVTEWMRDPGSARRLGQSARRLVEQTFSFRAFVTRAEDLLGTRHREPL
ncbi:MAG TPA: glycosyltransferase family 4 protein, partial [Candidatus Krumholzibacteria bacterium]